MIKTSAGGWSTWVTTAWGEVKLYKKAPHGRQSVQLFPAGSPHTRAYHTYFKGRFRLDPRDVAACSTEKDFKDAMKRQWERQSRAVR